MEYRVILSGPPETQGVNRGLGVRHGDDYPASALRKDHDDAIQLVIISKLDRVVA
jgi:hypothetical protein